MDDPTAETDALLAEVEGNINSHLASFEEEAERLRNHRKTLIAAREKTDAQLVRVERVIRALNPPEPAAKRPPVKKPAKNTGVSQEKVDAAKDYLANEFFKDQDILTAPVLREHFTTWSGGTISNVISCLVTDRFLRQSGVGEHNVKQYKLTAEAIASLNEEPRLAVVA